VTAEPGRGAPRVMSVSLRSRLYGFGSVYGKTLHDSRRTILIMAGLMAVMLLAGGAQYGSTYATAQSRTDLDTLISAMPTALVGVYGNPSPAHIQTLGGLISWKEGPSFAVTAGLWSILALSSTLAAEAQKRSLDFVAVAPLGQRRVAIEKIAAHVTGLLVVMAVVAGAAWLAGFLFGTLPGDAIKPGAAIGFALWTGLMALASGSVAFALAPVVGRAGAAGLAGTVMIGGYFLNGYQAAVPAFSGWANATWFGWTTQHQALAAQFDWPSLVPVALVSVVLFIVGVEAFARRDIGETVALPWPGLPAVTLGLRGPVTRSLGERLPLAIAWGSGIGLFGLVLGASSGSFSTELARTSSDSLKLFHTLFPRIDLTTSGGFLQLSFVEFGFILAGFASATLVAGWASDEAGGRLDLLLAAPLARARWAVSSGLGVFAAIGVMTALLALGVGCGAAIAGGNPTVPALGAAVLGLYAVALAGVGVGIGGLVRTSIAGEAVVVLVVATFLVDLIAPALKLPGWVHQLALTNHMGLPMMGNWDWVGISACLALALGGLALAGWGMSRRDIAT